MYPIKQSQLPVASLQVPSQGESASQHTDRITGDRSHPAVKVLTAFR